MEKFIEMTMLYLPNLALALLVLVVGWWIIGRVSRLVTQSLSRQEFDVSLRSFLTSLVKFMLQALLIISVASMIGIQTTSFVAILGAAGLAVGLALQGSLGNFAGGVLILIFRPFKVGDLIEAGGKGGVVKEIQIFSTILVTPENKTIILPNGPLSNGTVVNYSTEGSLLVETKVELSSSVDIAKVRAVAIEVMRAEKRILDIPAPEVVITGLKPGAIVIAVKGFTNIEDNVPMSGDLNEQILLAFAKNGFSNPENHIFVRNVI